MVDRRLYAQDIQGSIAHCKTLEKARVLTQTREPHDRACPRGGQDSSWIGENSSLRLRTKIFTWRLRRRLTELIGPLGGKLHTGRSRNDQVALDVRLYFRR